jgi:hypothetical protein
MVKKSEVNIDSDDFGYALDYLVAIPDSGCYMQYLSLCTDLVC